MLIRAFHKLYKLCINMVKRLEPRDKKKDEKINLAVTEDTLQLLDKFKFENCYSSRGEAVYALLIYYYYGKKPESLCPGIKIKGNIL